MAEEDTLTHNGRGTPVKYTGMTWSGFRPSDDRCIHHYLVPSNMFAVVVLGYLEEIYSAVKQDGALLSQIATLKKEIKAGIESYAVVKNKQGEDV